jgi:hypothetical protein
MAAFCVTRATGEDIGANIARFSTNVVMARDKVASVVSV